MRIDLRHRLISIVVAFLAAVGTAAEIDAGVWYGSSVGDERWVVGQDNHYYPYGMLMGESSNILASARGYKGVSFNPNLFGSKEYLTTASANLLDFTARTYDPTTLFFLTPDPLREKYQPYHGYLYCGANPIDRIDPDGREWEIEMTQTGNNINVNIKITGVLLNLSNETFDMDALNNAIRNQLEDVYTFPLDNISVNLTADIRLVEAMDDIMVTDHVFMVVNQSSLDDPSNSEEEVLAKTAGYGIWIGTKLASQTISGDNQRSIAHELGHTGGLNDVNLSENDLKIEDPTRNLMTQASSLLKNLDINAGILLEPVQINRLIYNYNHKNNVVDMKPYYGLRTRAITIRETLKNKKIKRR